MVFTNRVVTLIANPKTPCLTPDVANNIRKVVGATAVYFLADGIACDLPVRDSVADVSAGLSEAIADLPIDWVVQQADDRRKMALFADMDSTLIQQECIDELADEAGVGSQVAKITARAMRGEMDFEPALRERVGLLAGQPASIIQHVLETRITLMPGARELVATMRKNGAYCALVSGGFTQFTSRISDILGFDEHRANSFAINENTLTGDVIPPILGREAKVDALNDITKRRRLSVEDVIAVGDGANDLGMLNLAGSGVALHAKPVVAKQARFRIDHSDLTALLYIQGYRISDFVQ